MFFCIHRLCTLITFFLNFFEFALNSRIRCISELNSWIRILTCSVFFLRINFVNLKKLLALTKIRIQEFNSLMHLILEFKANSNEFKKFNSWFTQKLGFLKFFDFEFHMKKLTLKTHLRKALRFAFSFHIQKIQKLYSISLTLKTHFGWIIDESLFLGRFLRFLSVSYSTHLTLSH